MGLLFASLKFVHVGVLPRKEPQSDAVWCGFQGLGKVLPELLDGHSQRMRPAFEGDAWRRSKTGLLAVIEFQAVAAEGVGYDVVAIDVVGAAPILPAAGVLIQFHRRPAS